jgi:hypothetical protein
MTTAAEPAEKQEIIELALEQVAGGCRNDLCRVSCSVMGHDICAMDLCSSDP